MDLTPDQVARFCEDGFLIVDNILSAQQVERVLGAMNRVYSGTYNRDARPVAVRKPIAPFGTTQSVQWILNARTVDEDLWNIATDRELGRVAASLLRSSSVSILEDQLLDKPNFGVPVNLHQDYSYWRFSTSVNMLSCWIALCDVSVDMGPVELARGSHRWGFAERPRELVHGSAEGYLSAAECVIPPGAEIEFVPVVVPRGGGVFFYGLTFHGSRGNSTDKLRRAISLHWASAECRLDRTKIADYDHPYLFTGLRHGDRITNKYCPEVYPSPVTAATRSDAGARVDCSI